MSLDMCEQLALVGFGLETDCVQLQVSVTPLGSAQPDTDNTTAVRHTVGVFCFPLFSSLLEDVGGIK